MTELGENKKKTYAIIAARLFLCGAISSFVNISFKYIYFYYIFPVVLIYEINQEAKILTNSLLILAYSVRSYVNLFLK